MNINNELEYTGFENYYQASGDDYPDCQDYEPSENEDPSVEQTDGQVRNPTVGYTEDTFPGDIAVPISSGRAYERNRKEFNDKKCCLACGQNPCRKYAVLNKQGYYLTPDQIPRGRRQSKTTDLYTYPVENKPVFQQDFTKAQKSEYVSYDPNQRYLQEYGHYSTQDPKLYLANNYGDLEGGRIYEHQTRQYRMGHGVVKRFPVTYKMPKYYMKKSNPLQVSKRPSILSLPVANQPNLSANITKKIRFKNHLHKKKEIDPYAFSVEKQNFEVDHNQINSHGDHICNAMDQIKNDNFIDENLLLAEPTPIDKKTAKELVKYFKPKVPSSIKTKQINKNLTMESALQAAAANKKISLERLLTSLQHCETEKQKETNKCQNPGCTEITTVHNYNTISENVPSDKKSPKFREALPRASTSVSTSLDRIKSLDDHGALELHKSKSYIVNLIDRALSKELGTIPRERLPDDNMTTKKALQSISRHSGALQKELCHEVTAALADSFISNATAPQVQENKKIENDQDDTKSIKRNENNKICSCNLDDNYVKQLKQLRWGHIRHIQHEAKKLADLEEFLDRIGEGDP